jgi:hypothetical protein
MGEPPGGGGLPPRREASRRWLVRFEAAEGGGGGGERRVGGFPCCVAGSEWRCVCVWGASPRRNAEAVVSCAPHHEERGGKGQKSNHDAHRL